MIYVWSIIAFVVLLAGLGVLLIIAEKLLVNYGICKIDINAEEKVLEVDGGQTLLSALYENEVFIPSACGGQGTCGFCKVTVKSGGGPLLPTETPYLTRQEQRGGVRLACQVKIREDLVMRVPEELLNVKQYATTVQSTIAVTHDIKEIQFHLDDPAEISQKPGQYIQVECPSPDGPVYRAYSISSASSITDMVELNVRLIPGGIGSTYLHNLKVGDKVTLVGPYGEFILNEDPETELVCVGGGAGMAPMKNIIYSVYERWPERSCWLFFGCRGARDVFYLKEYQELAQKHPNFKVVYALSDKLEEGEQWDGESGFIHLACDKHLEANVTRQAFLCGPPLMIDAVTATLIDKGIPPGEIFYDKF